MTPLKKINTNKKTTKKAVAQNEATGLASEAIQEIKVKVNKIKPTFKKPAVVSKDLEERQDTKKIPTKKDFRSMFKLPPKVNKPLTKPLGSFEENERSAKNFNLKPHFTNLKEKVAKPLVIKEAPPVKKAEKKSGGFNFPLLPSPKKLYRKIIWSFVALTAILVLAVIYFSLSDATITIFPKQKELSIDFKVKVLPAEQAVDYDGDETVVGGQVVTATVRGRQDFSVSGKEKNVGQATGVVTIINNYSKSQILVATTRLLSPQGVLFRIAERMDVPAGGRVKVAVYADQSGKQGEIGPTKFTIPGLWQGIQDKIYAESDAPMTGAIKEIKSVTAEDLQQAPLSLKKSLYQEAINELEKKLGQSLTDTANSVVHQVIDQQIDAQAGDELENFTVDMTLKVIAIIIDKDILLNLGTEKLRKNLPSDRELIQVDQASLEYNIEDYDLENKTAELLISLTGQTHLRENSLVLDKSKVSGMSKKEAIDYFQQQPEIEKVEVKFSPFWVRQIPKLKDHIEINIEY